MSTHNMCFRGDIRKIFCGYPFLSGAIRLAPVVFCFVSISLFLSVCFFFFFFFFS